MDKKKPSIPCWPKFSHDRKIAIFVVVLDRVLKKVVLSSRTVLDRAPPVETPAKVNPVCFLPPLGSERAVASHLRQIGTAFSQIHGHLRRCIRTFHHVI